MQKLTKCQKANSVVKSFSILIVLIIITIANIKAQKNGDAIYLENGNIIRGTIILPLDSNKIGIELNDHSFYVFDKDEVDIIKQSKSGANPNGFSIKLGTCLYGGSALSSGTKIQGGYKFKDRFYLGLGSGIEGFNERYIPLFFEGEINISNSATQPFIYVYGGYNFYSGNPGNGRNQYYYDQWGNYYPIAADYNGGPLVGIGIGMNKHFSANFGMGFQLGYRFQRTSFSVANYTWIATNNWGGGYNVQNGSTKVSNDFNRFEIGVFLLF